MIYNDIDSFRLRQLADRTAVVNHAVRALLHEYAGKTTHHGNHKLPVVDVLGDVRDLLHDVETELNHVASSIRNIGQW
jgi:hypothetical protein